uniref:tyrosine--tRNA ligase n=1 Tax=Brassica oleracea var. oleracea TaxID=109376 RepID=A0A0D3AG60_BRAOL
MAVRGGALLNDTACKIRDPSREERKKEWRGSLLRYYKYGKHEKRIDDRRERQEPCYFPYVWLLYLGNLLGIIVLSWFQRCGHQAVGLIGDPSGKSLERPELDALTLEKNIAGIKNILVKILGGNARLLCDFLITTMLDFLKNVGRFARVGQMMAKESVKKRLESEQGMSYTEFSYQLLQGYDFVHLLDKEGVNVQIGGSDHSWN